MPHVSGDGCIWYSQQGVFHDFINLHAIASTQPHLNDDASKAAWIILGRFTPKETVRMASASR